MNALDAHKARRFCVRIFVDEWIDGEWVLASQAKSSLVQARHVPDYLIKQANDRGGAGHDVWATWKHRLHELRG